MSRKREQVHEQTGAGAGRASGGGVTERGATERGVAERAALGRGSTGPHASQEPHPARVLLDELSTLLEEERAALVRLDRVAIDGFAARKLELDAALTKTVAEHPLGASEKELLERVRNAALDNQLLLAHARSCVQGVLSLLAPKNTPRYTAPGHTAPTAHSAPDAPPLALNMRR